MRSWLEENNWLQCSFVSPDDVEILRSISDEIPEGSYLIVASQSCDVCAASTTEEYIEFSIAEKLESANGNFLFNKHPRCLHIKVIDNSQDEIGELYFELRADDKIRIKKNDIEGVKKIQPFTDLRLDGQTVEQYANWLAGRYNRPALPTEFERLLNEQWQKRKREKATEKANDYILGIYVDVSPDRDINEDEPYLVTLLFLITAEVEENVEIMQQIHNLSNQYVEAMEKAAMRILSVYIKTEKQVSIATFKNYKRLFLDSLSYKNNTPIPIVHV